MKKFLKTMSVCLMVLLGSFVFVACKEDDNTKYFAIQLSVSNAEHGTVYGAGSYVEGQTITIAAAAKDGYKFTSWSDGSTDAIRTITIDGNETLTANFEIDYLQISNTIDDIQYSIFNVDKAKIEHENAVYRTNVIFRIDIVEIAVKNLSEEIFITDNSLFKIVSHNENFNFYNGKYGGTSTYVATDNKSVSFEVNTLKTIEMNSIAIISKNTYHRSDSDQYKSDFESTLFSIYIGDALIGQFKCKTN